VSRLENRAKSVFVSLWLAAQVAAASHAVFVLGTRGFELAWASTLVAVGGFLTYFADAFVRKHTARTATRLPIPLGMATLGAAGALAGLARDGESALPAVGYTVGLGIVGGLAYVFWYSKLDRAPSTALRVGEHLPYFVLHSLDGREVTPTDFVGSPTVFLFYRGNWCPLCVAQIREVAASYRELAALGARVVLVSPQPEQNTRDLAARFDVPFEFLVDRDLRAARALGIAHEDGLPFGLQAFGYASDTVLPTVVVVGEDGRALFAHETDVYRIRPEPETFLAVLRAEPEARPELGPPGEPGVTRLPHDE
jgi:peroxiredoxin